MAKVRFLDQGIEVEVPVGTSILQAATKGGAPEGSACGGVCACSTCHVYVEEGQELLSEAEEGEEDILDKAFDVRMSSRLGCQAKIEEDGVISVRISKESLDAFFNEHPDVERPS
jgi:ferredoxin